MGMGMGMGMGDEEMDDEEAPWAEVVERAFVPSCTRSARTVSDQAALLQSVILSRSSWPIHPLFRRLGYRAWERGPAETLNFSWNLDDEWEAAAGRLWNVGSIDDGDGGVLPGYVASLADMFGGESVVLREAESNMLVLLLHRFALRYGIYVWEQGGAWVRSRPEWTADTLPTDFEGWEGSQGVPGGSGPWLENLWQGNVRARPGTEIFCVGKLKERRRPKLLPVSVVRIYRSALTLELQGSVRVSPVDVLRRPIRERCGREAVIAMTQYSSEKSGRHYLLASQLREVEVVTRRPGSVGNWVGLVAGMMSYVSRKHSRSTGTRSWICTLGTNTRSRLAFGMHQVVWFQPILPKGSMFETRRQFPITTLYRPPMLAAEALLVLNSLLAGS